MYRAQDSGGMSALVVGHRHAWGGLNDTYNRGRNATPGPGALVALACLQSSVLATCRDEGGALAWEQNPRPSPDPATCDGLWGGLASSRSPGGFAELPERLGGYRRLPCGCLFLSSTSLYAREALHKISEDRKE